MGHVSTLLGSAALEEVAELGLGIEAHRHAAFAVREPDHVVESITGHLSRRMLEHYSHTRLKAKKAALDRLDESTKGTSRRSKK